LGIIVGRGAIFKGTAVELLRASTQMDFLESQRSLFPDLEAQYSTLLVQHQSRYANWVVISREGSENSQQTLGGGLCRLWHQLTDSLLALFTHPGASRGDNFIQVGNDVVSCKTA
jgi:dolichyl-phosphate-mannose--protein O-mannosyl transferase